MSNSSNEGWATLGKGVAWLAGIGAVVGVLYAGGRAIYNNGVDAGKFDGEYQLTVKLEQEGRLIPTTACLRYKDTATRERRRTRTYGNRYGNSSAIGDLPPLDFNVQGYSESYYSKCEGGAVSVVLGRERSTENLKSLDIRLDDKVRVVWEPKDKYGSGGQPRILEKKKEEWVPLGRE